MLTQWGDMTDNGYKRWGHRQRRTILRRVIKAHIYTGWFFPNGVPVKYLVQNETMMEWIIDNLPIVEGAEYTVQGWSHKRTPTNVGFSGIKARFKVNNISTKQYDLSDTQRMQSYWFRKPMKKIQ